MRRYERPGRPPRGPAWLRRPVSQRQVSIAGAAATVFVLVLLAGLFLAVYRPVVIAFALASAAVIATWLYDRRSRP